MRAAWAIVRCGKVVRERVTDGRPFRRLCIYTSRPAANYYRTRNTEQVKKVRITVM